MRYIAKIHVLDVMDQVVVSGYVYDADPLTDPDHEPLEFTYQTRGLGLDDPVTWLHVHLYQAFHQALERAESRRPARGLQGDSHTISETGDTSETVMG